MALDRPRGGFEDILLHIPGAGDKEFLMAIHGSSSPGTKWPDSGLFSPLFYRKLEKRVKKGRKDPSICIVFAKFLSKEAILPAKNCFRQTIGGVFKKNQKIPCIGIRKCVIIVVELKG
jgi:hypothetical protein